MRRGIWIRTGLVTALFVAVFADLATSGDARVLDHADRFIGASVTAVAFALPWRAALAWLGSAWGLSSLTNSLNVGKLSLTDMPLTWLDLRIAAANPAGFLGAMKVSPTAAALGAGALGLVVIALVGWRLSRLDWAQARANLLPRAVSIALAFGLLGAALDQIAKRVETAIAGHEYAEIANMPDGLKLICAKIQVAPFLLLTARYDASSGSLFRTLAARGGAQATTGAAPATFLRPGAAPTQTPDIVVVLLESTFDLPKAFDVTPAMNSDLFPNAQKGHLQGELGVNAIGGGTWISEFEAITGVPSRLFGYAGYYTHVELAPYVKASLATYLRKKGYGTLALYPVEGKFYGARAAYGHYGFETWRDGVELGIENPWYAEDTDILGRYIRVIEAADTAKPLFAFALTMENHSPHPCTRFGSESEMPYRFVGDADARATCELNEYVARYRSTETGVAMLETALREREKKTGRPYVLAVFGDHQPNTFTGTAKSPLWAPHDYSKIRRVSNDVTFYQFRGSARSPFAVTTLDTSVVVLPTLISAYVAKDRGDFYLPGNFAVQARCGEKIALPRLNAAYGKDALIPDGQANADAAKGSLTSNCESALVAARSDYLSLIEMP